MSLIANAQDSTATKKSKFSLGVNFASEYAYRSITAINEGKDNEFLVDYAIPYMDSIETSKFGYTTGLSVEYKATKWLGIESGVYYSNKGYRNHNVLFYTSGGFAISTNNLGSITYSYNYVDVPLKLNFYITSKKLVLFLTAGAVGNIFIKKQTTVKFENKTEIYIIKEGYTKFNVSIVGGLGLDYNVSNKIKLRFEPQYKRFLNSILLESRSNNQSKTVLYSYGVNIGLHYKF